MKFAGLHDITLEPAAEIDVDVPLAYKLLLVVPKFNDGAETDPGGRLSAPETVAPARLVILFPSMFRLLFKLQ